MVTFYLLFLQLLFGFFWKEELFFSSSWNHGFLFSSQCYSLSIPCCVWLQHQGLQHARLLCPPLSPGVCSNSCPFSQWCYLTILSSASPFSSCLQSFPVLGSFAMSWLFMSGGQSIAASAVILPVDIQGWYPLGSIDLISLPSKGFSRVFSSTTIWKHQFFGAQPSLWFTLTSVRDYWKKPWLWLYEPLLAKWCLCFLICCIGLSPPTVILEPKKQNLSFLPLFSLLFAKNWWDWMPWSLFNVFQASFFPLSPSRGCLVPLHILQLEWYHLPIWGRYFSWQSWFQLVIHPAWHFTWCTLHIN